MKIEDVNVIKEREVKLNLLVDGLLSVWDI